mgnify:CR=1 FL=1|jgi:hypothetical protein|tara:strand:+ start:1191 stop:1364 length:174 start_codon:yes stop_codon:yes gene_type:complete
MKFTYAIQEQGGKVFNESANSLKKLIKKLDPKKVFEVKYVNKKGNPQTKKIYNGKEI